MPNHVLNEIIFRGVDRAAQDSILLLACGQDGAVDFTVLVPVPLNIWHGDVGSGHERAFGREMTGLDWQRKNWGTKWNAYQQAPLERSDDSLTLRFQTAWAPPYPWLVALLNASGLPFEHRSLDEGRQRGAVGSFAPTGRWGGPEWTESAADDVTHRHLHKLLWGVEVFDEEEDTPARQASEQPATGDSHD